MKKAFILLFALSALFALGAQEMTVANGAEPESLDPAFAQGTTESRILRGLFEGLTIEDPKSARAYPGLAEKWAANKDFTQFTFRLRNATWSDGVKITAKTVVDSWLRTLNAETAASYSSLVSDFVKGAKEYAKGTGPATGVQIKALNDRDFQVTLINATPHFPDIVSHYAYSVFPMHAIAKFGADWIKAANWVSNGPFVLKEWRPQEHVIMVKNPKYWDAKNVALQKVTFLPSDDNLARYNLFKAGQVDWMASGMPLDLMDEIKLRKDYITGPGYSTYYYIFNVTKKPFDDVRVRKALAMAVDKKTLVEKVTKGGQIPAWGNVPPSIGYNPSQGAAYNVEEAKKLLAAAGFPGGAGFPAVSVLYNTSEGHKKIGEFIQSQWKTNLGIDVSLVNQEWATYLNTKSETHDFQIARAGWVADYLDPSTFLDMWTSWNKDFDDGLYNSKAYDDLIKKSRTQQGAERFKTLMAAEKVLLADDQAIMPIYYYVNLNLIDRTKWDGWYENPLDAHAWKFIKPKK